MTDATDRPAESGWRYALAALIVFTLLGMDVLSLFVGRLLDGPTSQHFGVWPSHWYATAGQFVFSIALWTASAALVVRWARRRGALGVLFGGRWDGRVVAVLFLGALAVAAIQLIETAGVPSLSLLREYRGFERRYPGHGAIVTAFQYVYYLGESGMVVLILATWQRAGELWTSRARVPWGGVGLMLTWGLVHFLSHPAGALTVVASALVFGGVFVGARKNAAATLAVVYLAFVL